jgi:GDP-4-dehydro-6-deoxy-D-mannose reductase
MKKYLITGVSGFVGEHFIRYLEKRKIKCSVLGLDIEKSQFAASKEVQKYVSVEFRIVDLLDKQKIKEILYEYQPNYVLHLASYSSVAFSWQDPISSFANNTNIFLNLLEQIRILGLTCRILSVGSSEEYGGISKEMLPLKEDCALNPTSPYAVARVSQEMLTKVYITGFNLDIVMTRSFNHIGPNQRDIFAVSSFAKQIAAIKRAGQKEGVLYTGDVGLVRDFLDVRDVVVAYYKLLQSGKSGGIYNVCSGTGYELVDIIKSLADLAGVNIVLERKPELIRPNESRIVIGSNEKIRNQLNWKPRYSIRKSLSDLLKYWQKV